MAYFPFFVDIENQPCLIVGGGIVAYRKAQMLSGYCRNITVVAPKISTEMARLAGIRIEQRVFEPSDIDGRFCVITATDNAELNAEIFRLCQAKNILVNSVDDVENCSFIFPSLVHQGDISVGISTSGQAPVYAQYLKNKIKAQTVGDEEIVALLGSLRERVKSEIPVSGDRKKVYRQLLEQYLDSGNLPDDEQINQVTEEWKQP